MRPVRAGGEAGRDRDPMLVDELIKTLPTGTEEAVKRTKERLNQQIREALRQETGLRFRRAIEEDGLFGNTRTLETTNIHVRIEPGYPASLRRREPEAEQRLPALLAPWCGALEKLKEGSEQTRQILKALQSEFTGFNGYDDACTSVDLSRRLAIHMLGIAGKFDFVKWILDVNDDVLGLYTVPGDRLDARVDLYWGVIGLVSGMLAVSIEDLTAVILAHELAHAYTHLGSDIDGHCWSTHGFTRSSRAVLEGLAQYYTCRVCERLAGVAPGARRAYATLLPRQPEIYQTHTAWIKENRPEEVRLAMLQARRAGPVSLGDFGALLATARDSLRRGAAAEAD